MIAPRRRGACPGLAAPMATGDGLLARLRPAGTVGLDAFAQLCVAARRHGNGIVEITARGSIQIRGLSESSAPIFAEEVAALRIPASDGVAVVTGPLAGLDPMETVDPNPLAAALREALAEQLLGLSPKLSIALDGGGALHLDGLTSDLHLRAVAAGGAIFWHVTFGAIALGAVAPEHAVEAIVRLLRLIARRGAQARAKDIVGVSDVRGALADLTIEVGTPLVRRPMEPLGVFRWHGDRVALGVAPAFGHALADNLERLTDMAHRAGVGGIRAAPGRALLLLDLTGEAVLLLRSGAEELGFIVRADDPRRSVIACAGAPICSSAMIAARAIAPSLVAAAGPVLDGDVMVHVSGCPKGCAHAGVAALTIVGLPDGCGVIVNGTARDEPRATIAVEALPQVVALLAGEGGHG